MNDTCASGFYCDASRRCLTGCKFDAGSQCPLEQRCGATHACEFGCTDATTCGATQSCQLGACYADQWRRWSGDGGLEPPARFNHAMAVDTDRKLVVVFGGKSSLSAGTFLSDTWEWTEAGWTQNTTPVHPPGMIGHSMTYDPSRGKIVLFGGNVSATSEVLQSKTWEYDTATHRWAELTLSGTQPTARYLHADAWDSTINRVVIFGGDATGQPCSNDMWSFDGTSWQLVASSGAPHAYNQKMLFDTFRNQRVIWGGYCNSQYFHAPYYFDGAIWQATGGTPGPQGVDWPASVQAGVFTYVPIRRFGLYFGGLSDSGGGVTSVHRWNGTTWVGVTPITPGPGRRYYGTMNWLPWLNRLMLFGGADGDSSSAVAKNETWLYGGP